MACIRDGEPMTCVSGSDKLTLFICDTRNNCQHLSNVKILKFFKKRVIKLVYLQRK